MKKYLSDIDKFLDDLKEISDIFDQNKSSIEKEYYETLQKGERFNVFSVLNLVYKETMHSAFLAEFLSMEGKHGCGTIPLSLFIESIPELADWEFNVDNAIVNLEEYAGKIDEDNNEGGRIDITIWESEAENNQGKAKKRKLIIIENKIDAEEQVKQLSRYKKYAEDKKTDYKIIYLTKDGKKYGQDDVKENEYIRASYKEHIIGWMERCLQFAVNKPLVRETLNQYLTILKELTMETTKNSKDILLDELCTNHPELALVMANSKSEIMSKLWDKYFISKLEEYCKEKNHEVIDKGKQRGIKPNGWNNSCIAIENDEIGFWMMDKVSQYRSDLLGKKNNQWWPLGWVKLHVDVEEALVKGVLYQKFIENFEEMYNKVEGDKDNLIHVGIEL